MSFDITAYKQVYVSAPGSWAYDTAFSRIPNDIFPRLMAENDSNWPVDKKKRIISELNLLVQSLQSGTSGRLEDIIDPASPDESMWNVLLGGLEEKERNWVDAPWIIGEYYFYRQVVQAVRYYADGFDPFATTKHNGLCSSLGAIEDICSVYTSRLDASVRDSDSAVSRLEIAFGIYISLWGNKKDLSLWPAGREKTDGFGREEHAPSFSTAVSALVGQAAERVLEDHIDRVVDKLCGCERSVTVGIVVDNAGYELSCDLLLGYILIESEVARRVTFFTKGYPTFVSDATTSDCLQTIRIMRQTESSLRLNNGSNVDVSTLPVGLSTRRIGEGLHAMVTDGRIEFVQDEYWCHPSPFREMPADIRSKISSSYDALFIKGDANYRRLMDDRLCPYNTPSDQVFGYWADQIGVSMCALRTCKSEICCGVSAAAQERAEAEHGDRWVVNGEWGLVQFIEKGT